MSMPLFTVLIPTHDHADTLFYSISSVQKQTVQDFEIFVVGDGAPPRTKEVMAELMSRDSRIRYFENEKGERHGERHRHAALEEAKGTYVAYLADDDLWTPDHLETVRAALGNHDLVHTMHIGIRPDGSLNSWFFDAGTCFDLNRMRKPETGFGLASGAHTLDAYRRLPVGWRPAPSRFPTDLYFWLQFLDQGWCRYASIPRHTMFHFSSALRKEDDLAKRLRELTEWSKKLEEPEFRGSIVRSALQQIVVSEHWALAAACTKNSGPIEPEELLSFAQGARGNAYLIHGFSNPEPWGCWSVGEESTIFLPLATTLTSAANWHLRLTVKPFLHPPQREIASFRVLVNGREALQANETHSAPRTHYIHLEGLNLDTSNSLVIQLQMEKPLSPWQLGIGQDSRALGVGVIDCTLSRHPVRGSLP